MYKESKPEKPIEKSKENSNKGEIAIGAVDLEKMTGKKL